MQIQKVIEQLGYSAKEAKVYLATLALGEAHITDIAEKVKMPRSSTQVIADKLLADGLLTFYVMRRYKYWVAENPEHLLRSLEKREKIVRKALPKLTALKRECRNVTQQHRNSAKQLGPLRVIADTALQPVLIANNDIEIVYVNSIWEKQFGYTLSEVRGENPRIFKSGKTPNSEYVRMWRALGSGQLFQSDKITDKRKDGTTFLLLTTIFPLMYANRRFYIQILEDTSKRKQVDTLQKRFIEGWGE